MGRNQFRKNILLRIIGSLLCLFVILLGGGLSAFTGYTLATFEYMGEIFGKYVFFGGIYTILACGILTVLFGLISFYSFTHTNRFTAIMACVGLIFLSIVIGCTSVIVYAYPKTMTELIYNRMTDTFPSYGQVMTITNAWDFMQSYLRCCALRNRGWVDYNQTVWYKLTNADIHYHGELIPRTSDYYQFVPESCCVTLIDGLTGLPLQVYRNKKRCKNWQYGPPMFQDGPHNDALYYRGCYHLFVDYVNTYSRYILGVGLTVATLLIIIFLLLVYTELLTVPNYIQNYYPNSLKQNHVK
ncbi:unnamed protein product [Trichobilharzia szidati]|nr:unnamed protein product [Trichobilharzia szidati]